MENFGVVTVPAIALLAYLAGMVGKTLDFIDDRFIPVICGLVGIFLGILSMFVMADYPANDIVTAAAVGAASGLAATGVNQIVKQFNK